MTLLRRSPALAAIIGALLLVGVLSVWGMTGSASAGDSEKLEASLLSDKLEKVEAQVAGLQERVSVLEAALAKSKESSADRFAALLDKFWEHRRLLLEKIAAVKAAPDVIVRSFEQKDWDFDWDHKDWFDHDWGDKDWDHDWDDKDWGDKDWDHHDWDRD